MQPEQSSASAWLICAAVLRRLPSLLVFAQVLYSPMLQCCLGCFVCHCRHSIYLTYAAVPLGQ